MSDSDAQDPPKDLKDKDLKPREKTSGRVAFDARGNAVWEWKMKTGVFGRDVDTRKLRTLEDPGLEFADDPTAPPTGEQRKEAVKAAKRTGFDPYNSTSPKPRPGSAAAKPVPKPAEPPEKPGFFRRLFGKD